MLAAKSRLFVSAYRAAVGRIWIGDDAWRTGGQQPVDEGSNERGSVTAVDHVLLPDKLVDSPRTPGVVAQSVFRPDLGIVALQIAEGAIVDRHDELLHGFDFEITADEFELF